MEFVTGLEDRKVKTLEELEREESVGTEVTVEGMVHSIRDMGEISFVILRSRDGLLQTVIQAGSEKKVLSEIREGQAVRVTGTVFKEERIIQLFQLQLQNLLHLLLLCSLLNLLKFLPLYLFQLQIV